MKNKKPKDWKKIAEISSWCALGVSLIGLMVNIVLLLLRLMSQL